MTTPALDVDVDTVVDSCDVPDSPGKPKPVPKTTSSEISTPSAAELSAILQRAMSTALSDNYTNTDVMIVNVVEAVGLCFADLLMLPGWYEPSIVETAAYHRKLLTDAPLPVAGGKRSQTGGMALATHPLAVTGALSGAVYSELKAREAWDVLESNGYDYKLYLSYLYTYLSTPKKPQNAKELTRLSKQIVAFLCGGGSSLYKGSQLLSIVTGYTFPFAGPRIAALNAALFRYEAQAQSSFLAFDWVNDFGQSTSTFLANGPFKPLLNVINYMTGVGEQTMREKAVAAVNASPMLNASGLSRFLDFSKTQSVGAYITDTLFVYPKATALGTVALSTVSLTIAATIHYHFGFLPAVNALFVEKNNQRQLDAWVIETTERLKRYKASNAGKQEETQANDDAKSKEDRMQRAAASWEDALREKNSEDQAKALQIKEQIKVFTALESELDDLGVDELSPNYGIGELRKRKENSQPRQQPRRETGGDGGGGGGSGNGDDDDDSGGEGGNGGDDDDDDSDDDGLLGLLSPLGQQPARFGAAHVPSASPMVDDVVDRFLAAKLRAARVE